MTVASETETAMEEVERVCKAKTAFAETLKAVLLFHSASPWTQEKQIAWRALTGLDPSSVTVKGMCDHIRAVLAVHHG